MNSPGRVGGFTLIELLLVLAILGLAYAVAGPMLDRGSTGLDIKAASRQLAAGLRLARSSAIAQGREVALKLDVEGRYFSVTGNDKKYALPSTVDFALVTETAEQTDATEGGIRFFPDGTSTGGVITASIGEARQKVEVSWVTGRTHIR